MYRRLRQDVLGFRKQTQVGVPDADPALTLEQLAAKMVGRWPSGAPVELSPETDNGEVSNAFQYQEDPFDDDQGIKTPRWAHIRKANPRDETRPDPTDLVQRHRMIRRGIPFGPALPAEATEDDGHDRGLEFIAVVSDPARQFEFVQRRWLNDPNFPNGQPAPPTDPYAPPESGEPADGPDPVVGEHEEGATDSLHQESGIRAVALLLEVVTVTAGEYFFLPSIHALTMLGEGATASSTS